MKKLVLLFVFCIALGIVVTSVYQIDSRSDVMCQNTSEQEMSSTLYSDRLSDNLFAEELLSEEYPSSEVCIYEIMEVSDECSVFYEESDVSESHGGTIGNNKLQHITSPSKHCFVYDSSIGITTHQGGLDDRIYMASITKLYTIHVALKYLKTDSLLTVGRELEKVALDSSVSGLKRGDVLTVEQLIAGMLLPSGNDAAYTLATAAGMKILDDPNCSIESALNAFVIEMNRQASVDGLGSTHFVNPDGYHNDMHYTSMSDVLKIAKIALKNETILKYTSMISTEININGRILTWQNTNLLINPESVYYRENIIGLKTGYTGRAGSCILVAEKIDDIIVIAGVFGCSTTKERYEEVISLLNG